MKQQVPSSTLSLVLSTLQEIRLVLRTDLNELPSFHKWCVHLFEKQRDSILAADLLNMNAIDKTVAKELFMFLLSCHDSSLQHFIDVTFNDFGIEKIEYKYIL